MKINVTYYKSLNDTAEQGKHLHWLAVELEKHHDMKNIKVLMETLLKEPERYEIDEKLNFVGLRQKHTGLRVIDVIATRG